MTCIKFYDLTTPILNQRDFADLSKHFKLIFWKFYDVIGILIFLNIAIIQDKTQTDTNGIGFLYMYF